MWGFHTLYPTRSFRLFVVHRRCRDLRGVVGGGWERSQGSFAVVLFEGQDGTGSVGSCRVSLWVGGPVFWAIGGGGAEAGKGALRGAWAPAALLKLPECEVREVQEKVPRPGSPPPLPGPFLWGRRKMCEPPQPCCKEQVPPGKDTALGWPGLARQGVTTRMCGARLCWALRGAGREQRSVTTHHLLRVTDLRPRLRSRS